MSDQLALGFADKEAGQAQALDAVPSWHDEAIGWFIGLRWGQHVTADDLVAAIGLPRESGVNRNNAVGAAFSAAKNASLLTPVGYAPSKRRESHGRTVRVWQRCWA